MSPAMDTPNATPRFQSATINGDKVVREPARGLMWDPGESEPMTHKQCEAWVKELRTGGFTDWRLPTRVELLSLVDDTRHSPAIDTAFFPKCKRDWYWTSTPAACSPADYVWSVFFSSGGSYWIFRGGLGFVRAVRAIGESAA